MIVYEVAYLIISKTIYCTRQDRGFWPVGGGEVTGKC